MLGRAMIDLDDHAGLDQMDIRRKIQQSRRRRGRPHGLIVVDYLQLVEGEGDNRNQALGKVANGLKRAAKDFGSPIVLLSQLSRKADEVNGPPHMSHLRDSGDIEGAADNILLLYREHQRNPTPENKHHMEIHAVKQKNGPTGVVNVHFDGATQRLGNWDGAAPNKQVKRARAATKGMD
jgi:replicative DNA helicase